jgi:coenzyme F420-0:L-glutamate ligase/coenzyme F420-1:gamma-L-glutamate ligase
VSGRLEVVAPGGVGEVRAGDDLAGLLLGCADLRDGDVVTVTSKVVSKAEGRERAGDRDESVARETVRVVARRGDTRIVRNRLGLTMAAAGVDASNVPPGRHLLLPEHPDRTARRLREEVLGRTGRNVAVLVTDTAGRPWREGQTDIAIGVAGLVAVEDLSGRRDAHGNPLRVTAPAVADELAGAAELAAGKLGGRPFVIVRGRSDLVLPPGDHGPGAAALLRPEGADMFGLGSREAVVAALAAHDRAAFGSPAPAEEVAAALAEVPGLTARAGNGDGGVGLRLAPPYDVSLALARAVLHAFGWEVDQPVDGPDGRSDLRPRPALP